MSKPTGESEMSYSNSTYLDALEVVVALPVPLCLLLLLVRVVCQNLLTVCGRRTADFPAMHWPDSQLVSGHTNFTHRLF